MQFVLDSICCGKRKSTMSPLRKQGSRAKNWIPAFGPVAKVQNERFEITARFFESLAMT